MEKENSEYKSFVEGKKKLHWFPIVVTNKFINEVEKLITYNR